MEDDKIDEQIKRLKEEYGDKKENNENTSDVKTKANTIDDLKEALETDLGIKAIGELFKIEGEEIEVKTDLKDREIKNILKCIFMYKEFNVPDGINLIYKYMRLRLSHGRSSRKEIIDLLKSDMEHDMRKKGVSGYLFGGGMQTGKH